MMDVEEKVSLLKSFAAEIVTEEELRRVFETNDHPNAYDGFEPSGIAPIHFGLLRAVNLKKMLNVGVHFKLYLADYFAFINNKLGGNLEHIKTAGKYFVEVWKACGVDTNKVEVIWASDLMDNLGYWDRFMHVGKAITLDRVKRAITIMGRHEGEKLSAAQLYYPAMQVSDIFQMDIDICQLGIDQRRANVLAREVAERYGWKKPAVVSHPLVLGLQGIPKDADLKHDPESAIEYKMSKSNPRSAIYMHDPYEVIKEKVNSAYCPEGVVEGNPLLNYLKLIVMSNTDKTFSIKRPQKFGGDIEVSNYQELEALYKEKKLHPMDLKAFVTEELEVLIKPVREHFEKNSAAKALYEEVKSYTITR